MRFLVSVAVLMFVAIGSISCACAGTVPGKAAPDIVSARVSLGFEAEGNRVTRELGVGDEATIRTLLTHLPGVGTGRTSRMAGGWINLVEIILVRADGSEIRVGSDFENWSEGDGDWDVDAGFEPFIRGLFR